MMPDETAPERRQESNPPPADAKPGEAGRLPAKALAAALAIAAVASVILQGLTGASWILALLGGIGTAMAVTSLSLDARSR